ncbi:hypothetical protein N0V90_012716 [Kalmusia sp. IMI 367209]|nr:hypothetical protein N0V90_012716 [Kalmusia sp. IMI 367209]
MTDHEKQIEEFGKNDDFWLFGYGCVSSQRLKMGAHKKQESNLETTTTLREDHRGTPEAPGRVATLIDRAHWETLTDHHESTERVWGAAYHIPAAKVPEVREYLDIREINGYSIQFTPFHQAPFSTSISSPRTSPAPGGAPSHHSSRSISASTTISAFPSTTEHPIDCLVYIGLPSNQQFLGPQDPQELARHILKSRGPSGENREYLFMLERALGELSRHSGDAHVSDLVRRCKEIEKEEMEKLDGDEGVDEAVDEDRREDLGHDGAGGVPLHKVGSTEEQEEVER